MRKIFTLFAAMLLAITVNATVKEIGPKTGYDKHDNLRLALHYATAGDTIMLTSDDTVYVEKDNYLYFDKDVVVMAAEGKKPVIGMYTYAQIKNGAKVKIKGLKFDGAQQGLNGSSYSYYFRFYDNSKTSLVLEDCEFYGVKQYVLYGNSSSHTDSLIVNNCYFHNNVKNAIYFEASGTEGRQTCDKLVVKNSTIANTDSLENFTSTIDIRPYGTNNTDAIKVIVDHCTFYNNPTINTDHSSIRPYHLTDVTISNCIFVKGPNQKQARNATSCYGGNIKNCLVYNLDYSSSGHRDGTVKNNIVADPLFVDVSKGFQVKGNWTTGEVSPARGAATDGTDLGDPRWYTAETNLPDADLTAPYFLNGSKAQLKGTIKFNTTDSLYYSSNDSTNNSATWRIHALNAGRIQVTINYKSGEQDSGHLLKVIILDDKGSRVGDTLSMASKRWTPAAIDVVLPSSILLPKAGDYTIKLINDVNHSGIKLRGLTLSLVDRPSVRFRGEFYNSWENVNMTLSADKLSASATVNLGVFTEKQFGVELNEANWRVNGYYFFRGDGYVTPVTGAANITSGTGENMRLTTDKAGDYTFTWFFENDSLAITFPELTNANGYYLVGIFSGSEEWSLSDLTPAKKFEWKRNEGGDEYELVASLAESDHIKVIKVYGDALQYWYPDGSGNDYIMSDKQVGPTKTIYFRPDGSTYREKWHYNVIYVPENDPTAIDNTVVGEKAVKFFENGQLFIQKDGKTYNILGTIVK